MKTLFLHYDVLEASISVFTSGSFHPLEESKDEIFQTFGNSYNHNELQPPVPFVVYFPDQFEHDMVQLDFIQKFKPRMRIIRGARNVSFFPNQSSTSKDGYRKVGQAS